jgi:mannose-6-phosphate isomerase
MKTIGLLKNAIMDYAWGSPFLLPKLLGKRNPSGRPWAELWMGAHPKAPSKVKYKGRWVSLKALIEQHPQETLGRRTADRFDNTLPYLFKVLAVAKPLSIQAHPSLKQAQAGYEMENRLGIPLDSPKRNFRDGNHKPECICAMSKFHALCGFRKFADIVALLTESCPRGIAAELEHLRKNPDAGGLKKLYLDLMRMDSARRQGVIHETLQNTKKLSDQQLKYWIERIASEYPNDIAILSPMLLNLICLEPGQALFLPAGELHAYLDGFGIELMANSDNVLRGGLTEKHIDLQQLVGVVHFTPRKLKVLKAATAGKNEQIFFNPSNEFVLSRIGVGLRSTYQSPADRSIEILLCTDGRAVIKNRGTGDVIEIKKGDSVVVPAALKRYSISGTADFYKAAVPD